MVTVPWSSFLPDILIEVPGASDPLVESHVREAAIEFCAKSKAYVHRVEEMDIDAALSTYEWDIPSKTMVVEPIEVWLNKTKILPRSPSELSRMYSDWTTETGTPLYYLNDYSDARDRQLVLVPQPAAAYPGGVTARLALKPSRAASAVDELIFEEFGQLIAIGAKSRLMVMPDRPWSNANSGMFYRQQFELGIAQAAMRAEKGHSRAPLRTRATYRVQ